VSLTIRKFELDCKRTFLLFQLVQSSLGNDLAYSLGFVVLTDSSENFPGVALGSKNTCNLILRYL